MANWFKLTKTLLRMMFRRGQNEGSRTAATVTLCILGGLLSIGIAVTFGIMGPVFKEYGIVAELATVLCEMGFVIVLVFGTLGIFSYVYFSKDSEFLLSLPVRTSTVYLAKLASVYVQEVLLSTLIMFPGLLALGISTLQPAAFYIMILLAVALVPVCALFLASIVAIPMMAVSSFFKNKGAVSAILLILLFAVIMGVYMYVVMNVQTGGMEVSPEEMLAGMRDMFGTMARVLYPLYCLARFGTLTAGFAESVPLSAFIDMAIFLGTVAAAGALTVFISGRVYGKSVLRQNENAASTAAAKEYVQGSVLKALVKKEWRELSRNTSFAFQCLAGVVISPLFAVIFSVVMSNQIMGIGTAYDHLILWSVVLLIVQMMGIGMNQCATTAVTREGQSFAYSKSMPVPFATQVLAKVILSDIIGTVTIVASVIAMTVCSVILGGFDIIAVVMTLIFLLVYSAAYVNLCVMRDLKNPKLNWSTPREAVKGNYATVVPMLLDFLISFVCTGVLIAFTVLFGESLGLASVGMLIAFTVFTIVAALVCVFSAYSIKNNSNRYYERLSV